MPLDFFITGMAIIYALIILSFIFISVVGLVILLDEKRLDKLEKKQDNQTKELQDAKIIKFPVTK